MLTLRKNEINKKEVIFHEICYKAPWTEILGCNPHTFILSLFVLDHQGLQTVFV